MSLIHMGLRVVSYPLDINFLVLVTPDNRGDDALLIKTAQQRG